MNSYTCLCTEIHPSNLYCFVFLFIMFSLLCIVYTVIEHVGSQYLHNSWVTSADMTQ